MSAAVKNKALLDTLRWYKALKESSNEAFLPLFFDEHRYLVLKGGGGSGKSIFAGRKVLERCVSEPEHRFLVCRKVAKSLRDSCFEQLKGQLAQFYPRCGAKIKDLNISFPNGSRILFSGLDDVDKLKSIYNITGIWIEEAAELDEEDFNQLDIRLRTRFPYYLQILLCFNPVSATHWLKKRFWDRHDPRALVHESTYRDNRFLTEEAKKTLEGFKDIDPYYYMVYALGEWGVSGRTVFQARAVSERLEHAPEPVKTGLFEYDVDPDGVHISNARWVDDENGPVRIYREPEDGRPYVIGGDTAGDGSDWFVGQVLDNVTGEQAGTLRHQYDEDTYARQMFCLGQRYNNALLAVETNFSTYPVKLLSLMGYPRQYVRETPDRFDGSLRHAFGFRTDKRTRQEIIGGLVKTLRGHIQLVNDRETLLEMLAFVRNDAMRAEADKGAHDDCVMALAIAHRARSQQSTRVELPTGPEETAWSEDMWEDYQNANAKERALLIEQWGKPRL